MNNKALYNISYGVYMLATKCGEKLNGCIVNTCVQVASNPTRVSIACINANYTCELIKESGVFTLSVLDNTCTFDTIKRFGMQSGRDVDKFNGIATGKDADGIPYLPSSACSMVKCKVVQQLDLGSHTLFIAEVVDAEVLSQNAPLTYADYQSKLKPKAAKAPTDKKIVAWKCKICGYVYEGAELPKDYTCPLCGHPAEDFEPVYG